LADEQAVMRTGLPIIAHSEKATYAENIIRWWSTSKAPLYDQTGRMIGTFGFSSEQTELKKAELSLSTERHLLEVLLTGLPDAVFIKDKSGHFLLANQVIAQWLGCTPASLRGRHDFDYYPAEFVETYRKDEEAILRTGMPLINKEEVLRTPDGRNLFLLTTKLPYKNQSGEIIGIIGICRNVTLRKEYDAQMKLVHAENESLRAEVEPLRKEVARLTAELSQARSG
jgi:PAS domain S-box-containing protein